MEIICAVAIGLKYRKDTHTLDGFAHQALELQIPVVGFLPKRYP